jgi:hypothetical protein
MQQTAGILFQTILNSVGSVVVTYYAESSNGLCKSLNRTAVTLIINAVDPVGSDQTVCSDGTANQSLTAIASGDTITWYTAAVGGMQQ